MSASTATVWTELGRGIHVRQSALYATHSVVLLDPAHTVVIDPAVLPAEIDDIARMSRAAKPEATTLVFTHGDWDHVLGAPWWPDASTLAHDRLAGEVRENRDAIRADAERAAQAAGERWAKPFEPFRPAVAVSGLHFRKLGPWRTVFRDAYGHSASMLSLHLPEHRTLIAADMLSDIEIPMIEQSCELYRHTLDTLLPVFAGGAIETLIPGHGTIARSRDEAQARLERDRTYLAELEARVRAARVKGQSLAETRAAVRLADCMPDAPANMDDVHQANVARVYAEQAPT